jgi:hypothetical protein
MGEEAARQEPAPAWTDTWHPLSHGQVIDAVQLATQQLGWQIGRKAYSIRKGSEMFATWEIQNQGNGEGNFELGFRNSIAKTLAVGVCIGRHITVCSNLIFRGDFVIFRKHTGALYFDEICVMAVEALQTLEGQFDLLKQWQDGLKNISLADSQVASLLLAGMARPYPIMPPARFGEFKELYFDEGSKYTRTMHGFHGALTEMMKDAHPVRLPQLSQNLVRFVDYEAPIILNQLCTDVQQFDFGAIRSEAHEKFLADKKSEQQKAREANVQVKQRVKETLAITRAKKNGKTPALPLGEALALPKPDSVLETAARKLTLELGIPMDKAMDAVIKAKAELALQMTAKENKEWEALQAKTKETKLPPTDDEKQYLKMMNQQPKTQEAPEIGARMPQESPSRSPLVNLPREAIRAAADAVGHLLDKPGTVCADPPKKPRKKRISKEKFQKPQLIKEIKETKKAPRPLKPLKGGYSGSLNLRAAVDQARKEEAEKE